MQRPKATQEKELLQKNKKKTVKSRVPTINQHLIIARILKGLLVLILFMVLFFLVKNFSYGSQQAAIREEIFKLQTDISRIQTDSKVTDNLDVFGRMFVSAYYDTDKEKEENYTDTLSRYFAKDMTLPKLAADPKTKKLVSVVLWGKQTEEHNFLLSYLVTYHWEGDDQTAKEIMTFKVKPDSQKYNVVSYPYFQDMPSLTNGEKKKDVPSEPSEKPLPEKETADLLKWLAETFLPRYYNDTAEDEISYMMDKPQVLGKSREFIKIASYQIYPQETGFLVIAEIDILERETKKEEKQQLEITIEKQDNGNFTVHGIQHY